MLSIIINVFDGEKYIAEAIKSVSDQDCLDAEIVVVDNHSNDTTADIVQDFLKYENIKYYRTPLKLSLSEARNFALQQVTKDYVIFLDCDDTLKENALNIIIGEIRKSPNRALYFGAYEICDERNIKTITSQPRIKGFLVYILPIYIVNPIALCGAVLNLSYLRRNDIIFDNRLNIYEEFDIFLNLKKSLIKYIPVRLANYRIHESNYSKEKYIAAMTESSRVYKKHRDRHSRIFVFFRFKAIALALVRSQNRLRRLTSLSVSSLIYLYILMKVYRRKQFAI